MVAKLPPEILHLLRINKGQGVNRDTVQAITKKLALISQRLTIPKQPSHHSNFFLQIQE